MTPGLARCFRYKRGTPSGTEGDMQSDQTPSANSRAADAEWPRHGGAQAAGHERRPPDRPAPGDAASRQGFGLPRLASCPGTAAR